VRALVTGASGFVGAHVARALAERGAEVRAFCRSAPPERARVAEHVSADVRDCAALERAAAGCEVVVHVAALYSYARDDRAEMRAVNVDGTTAVLDAAARAGVRRVLVTSSATTCGPVAGRVADERDRPTRAQLRVAYKRTKLEAERVALLAAARGMDVVVVNPTAVVGPGDRRPTPTGAMVAGVASGRIRGYTPGAGLNVVAVADVAAGHALALEHGRRGRRYILGGENVSLRELFAYIAAAAGRPAPRVPVPWSVALTAAHVADVGGRALRRSPRLLVLDEVRLAGVPEFFSSARAEGELGYHARPARAALAEAVASLGLSARSTASADAAAVATSR
jgi:dihydroflavonol-4-reductase